METGYVELTDGTRLHYRAAGTGRPVVLIHGLWASGRFFQRQFEVVAAHHRVIVPDLRGHGKSGMPAHGHTVAGHARDLADLLARLEIERPILAGWSMGAFIAWEHFKLFGGSDIAGLVVVDQAPTDFRFADCPDALLGLDELRDWHAGVLTGRDDFMRMVLPMMFHTPPAPADAEWMVAAMCSAPATVAAAIFVDQSLQDYRPMIASYTVPTLVCSGAKSAQPASGARFLRDHLPDGRLEIFEESGHCLFWEESERFNAVLLDFIAACDAA